MAPMIEFIDYTFQYRAQKEPALRNINLTICPGEKVLVVGPSGSGKSTLACCINGLVPFSFSGKSRGTVKVKGENPARAGILGMSRIVRTVLQDADSQFVGMTVAEDIAFILENEGMPQKEMTGRVKEIAEAVGVGRMLERAPGELSRGQRQGAAMAGALAEEAEVFLFDSPLSNLDPEAGKRIVRQIAEISQRRNSTVIVIEQRVEDMLCLDADRIVIMDGGRIAAEGKPEILLSGNLPKQHGLRAPFCAVPFRKGNDRAAAEGKPGEWELSVKGLYFSYAEGEPMLQHIHFDLRKGEMVSIIGKNGGGKSTIAEIICGFRKPSRGSVTFRGEDILSQTVRERGKRIGLVMQHPGGMLSNAKVYRQVAAGLAARGMPKREAAERVSRILGVCGLQPLSGQKASALSFGQKKRVMIACVLAAQPEILILDDPTAGLEDRQSRKIMEYLQEIKERCGVTVLLITQDMRLALEYTDRSIVVSDGHLLADDTPARVLADENIRRKACLGEGFPEERGTER